jgi:hypothetical protein
MAIHIERREFIATLGGTAAWPLADEVSHRGFGRAASEGVQRTSRNAVKSMMRPMEIGSSFS